jgi:hypothetical protein
MKDGRIKQVLSRGGTRGWRRVNGEGEYGSCTLYTCMKIEQ